MIKTIAILLVMLVVNLLMILSISRAAKRVDYSLRRYFVQKLGHDDLGVDLPENVWHEESGEIEQSSGVLECSRRINSAAAPLATVEQSARANYKNNNLKEEYKAIKRISGYTPEHALECAKMQVSKDEEAESFKDYKGLFGMLDYDTVFAMNALDPETQETLLRSALSPEHAEILEDFLEENSGRFDCIEFYGYLDQMAALYNSDYSILTGNTEDDGRLLEDGTAIAFNGKICEGAQVIYKNKMYDFSI